MTVVFEGRRGVLNNSRDSSKLRSMGGRHPTLQHVPGQALLPLSISPGTFAFELLTFIRAR